MLFCAARDNVRHLVTRLVIHLRIPRDAVCVKRSGRSPGTKSKERSFIAAPSSASPCVGNGRQSRPADSAVDG